MSGNTMRAAVYTGPGTVVVEDRPLPEAPAAGELLVRVRVCGVCGSDVTDWYMTPRAPVVLGHEPAGDVVAVGDGVTGFAVGDRVAIHHHVPCMVCDVCQHGHYTLCPTFKRTRLYPAGMAEYVRIPAEIVASDILKLPDHLPYEAGALVEPVACVVRAMDRANIRVGDTVIVLGAGFNGILMGMLAPLWGASRVAILDRTPVRLARAQSYDIHTFNIDDADLTEQIRAWSGGVGPHAVMVTPSSPQAMEMGFDLAGPGATVLLYGPASPDKRWELNVNRVLFHEITVTGTYSASPHDTRRSLALMANGALDPNKLITHRLPLDQAQEAWNITKAAGDSLKVMVEFA